MLFVIINVLFLLLWHDTYLEEKTNLETFLKY